MASIWMKIKKWFSVEQTSKSDLEKYLESKNIKTQEELEFYLKKFDEDRYTSSRLIGIGDYVTYAWFNDQRFK